MKKNCEVLWNLKKNIEGHKGLTCTPLDTRVEKVKVSL